MHVEIAIPEHYMQEIRLLTGNNSFYRDAFLDAGYSVLDSGSLRAPERGHADACLERIAIIEIADGSLDTAAETAGRMMGEGARVLCLARADTPAVRGFLFEAGIADLFTADRPRELVESVAAPAEPSDGERGVFVMLDDRGARVRIMRSVAGRFGYGLRSVVTVEEFFEELEADFTASFVNLGASGFNINGFIRRSHSNGRIKLAPFMAYKDTREGIFVNEVISGLNRLTKVILSPEEMFGFVTGMLFRKEIVGPLDEISLILGYPESAGFARESFGRLCFSLGMGAFEMANVLNEADHARMRNAVERMRRALAKSNGIRWLVRDVEKLPTCGAGGA